MKRSDLRKVTLDNEHEEYYFHKWKDNSNSAIIECEDGRIMIMYYDRIRFLPDPIKVNNTLVSKMIINNEEDPDLEMKKDDLNRDGSVKL